MKIYQKEYINTFSLQFLNVLFVLDQQRFDIIAGSGDRHQNWDRVGPGACRDFLRMNV